MLDVHTVAILAQAKYMHPYPKVALMNVRSEATENSKKPDENNLKEMLEKSKERFSKLQRMKDMLDNPNTELSEAEARLKTTNITFEELRSIEQNLAEIKQQYDNATKELQLLTQQH